VLVPLPCSKPGQHFKNILLYKIKWAFVFQCVIQTVACLTFSIPQLDGYFIPLFIFFFLKIYVHIFVYTKIKYKDDGRDYVSLKEFLSIHFTFSVLHACLTYYVIYSLMANLELQFCINQEQPCMLLGIEFITWNVFALIIIAIEMSVYLAYYKDVIFCFITLANYVGMAVYI
jgi:hypothetical protein